MWEFLLCVLCTVYCVCVVPRCTVDDHVVVCLCVLCMGGALACLAIKAREKGCQHAAVP